MTRGRATITQVARAAGVSVASASRALNGLTASPEMRERVEAAAREMNYVADARARSLKTGKTMTLGYFVSDIGNPVYVEMMAAGVLVIANNSGGPKADIVKPETGYLALTADEYATKIMFILNKSPAESIEMRKAARKSSLRYSDKAFGEQFIATMSDFL